jgi:GT2 family glycosyltransferase
MVFVIIPVFNRVAFTLKCLASVHRQTYRDLKVIVVDDGSTDGTAEQVKQAYPEVTVLKGDGNYYWTKSLNTGIRYVQPAMKPTDFILHINNDTAFDSTYLEDLLAFHHRHPNCIIGSLAYDPNSKMVSHTGIFYSYWWPLVKRNYKEEEIELDRLKNIEYLKSDTISGRGLLIPGYVIEKAGLLDEQNFPQYRSDEDYALRCRKAGINVYISTAALVYNNRENTGYDHTIHAVSWKKFYASLFSLLSTNNLSIRWKWAKKNARIPLIYYPLDVSILLLGFLKSIVYRKFLSKRLN